MRDYFNKEEFRKHLATLSCQQEVEEFKDCNCLTEEEKNYLNRALKSLYKANCLIIQRLGVDYANKIKRTMKDNKLTLVAKDLKTKAIIDIDEEAVANVTEDIQVANCFMCDKKDYKNCQIRKMFIALELDATNPVENECEYKG